MQKIAHHSPSIESFILVLRLHVVLVLRDISHGLDPYRFFSVLPLGQQLSSFPDGLHGALFRR